MKIERSVVGRTVQLPENEYFWPISFAAPAPNGIEGITSAVQPGLDAIAVARSSDNFPLNTLSVPEGKYGPCSSRMPPGIMITALLRFSFAKSRVLRSANRRICADSGRQITRPKTKGISFRMRNYAADLLWKL